MYKYFFLAFLLRILAIGRPFIFEDTTFPVAAISGNYIRDQPPLFIYTQEIIHAFLPLSEVSARLIPLIGNLVILGLVYSMTKRAYGKKPAVCAFALAGISHQLILNGLMVHNDTALLPMFVLSALFMYLFLIQKEQKTSGLVGLSLFLTAALLTKNYAVLAFAFILGDMAIRRTLKEKRYVIASLALSLVLFLVYITIFSHVMGIDFIKESILLSSGRFDPSYFLNPVNAVKNFAKLAYALTIPGLLLVLISALKRRKQHAENTMHAWVLFWFAFFLLPTGDKLRYFHILIPVAFILIGKEVSEVRTSLKEIILSTAPSLILLFMLAVRVDYPYLKLYPIHFLPFVILTLAYMGIFRNNMKKALLLTYICFSIYIVTDLSFHIVSPDYGQGITEGINYIQSEGLNPDSIAVFIDMGYYANLTAPGEYLVIPAFLPDQGPEELNRSYFILTHQYYVDPFPAFSEFLSSCEIVHSLSEKETTLLLVYRC